MKARRAPFAKPMVLALLNTQPGVWPPQAINPELASKWQTRRIIPRQPSFGPSFDLREGQSLWNVGGSRGIISGTACPVEFLNKWAWGIGDRVRVLETWAVGKCADSAKPSELAANVWLRDQEPNYPGPHLWWAADGTGPELSFTERGKWRPGRFAPNWVPRIHLEVKLVRAERLQDITPDDCVAEGIRIPIHEGRMAILLTGKNTPSTYLPKTEAGRVIEPIKPGDMLRALYACLIDDLHGTGTWDSNPWVFVYAFGRVK